MLDACLIEYDNFINLPLKHADFQPVKMNRKEGGIPLRLLSCEISESLFTSCSFFSIDHQS